MFRFADIVGCNALFVVRLQVPLRYVVVTLTGLLTVPRNTTPQDTPAYLKVEKYFSVQYMVRRLFQSRARCPCLLCIAAALLTNQMHGLNV
jgi:hypothetical protein